MPTLEELAKIAFDKAEYVRILDMLNMPMNVEERRQAFIRHAQARAEANVAKQKLDQAIEGKIYLND